MEFKGQQLVLYKAIIQRAELAMAAAAATDEAEGDALREKAHGRDHKPLVCSGPPGTGKTTVVHAAAREVLRRGGCVELAMPTGRMMTRTAEKLGVDEKLVVETCAAAFQLHKPEQEALFAMYGYALVVADEYSQLSMDDFERILRLWAHAGNLPALVFVGDKYQLPGVDPHRAWESAAWKAARLTFVDLFEVFRTKDKTFLEMLRLLRTCMPSESQLHNICRGCKAWEGDEPSVSDIKGLLRDYPHATFLAATRIGVRLINDLAVQALHPRAAPLGKVDGVPEDNPENYQGTKLRTDRPLRPTAVPIYKGLRLMLTRNIRKADDYVNGMQCDVLSYNEATRVLMVRTVTGKRLPITPWHDPERPGPPYFPVRLGYCTTVHKARGDELDFAIIYLDTPNMPAIGYTALSRVRDSTSYLLGGELTPEHFVPVTMRWRAEVSGHSPQAKKDFEEAFLRISSATLWLQKSAARAKDSLVRTGRWAFAERCKIQKTFCHE